MRKQHIAIIRDHSASMEGLRHAAKDDYNSNVAAIRDNVTQTGITTFLTTVKCGVGYAASVITENELRDVIYVNPLMDYVADGHGTPLFDSIGRAIEILERSSGINDPETAFLVMAITDGENNRTLQWNQHKLREKFKQLEATGRWTFIFRVPQGRYKNQLINQFGISGDNILEWEATTKGVEVASAATNQGMQTYYAGRSRGVGATSAFYTNLQNVSVAEVKQKLTPITHQLRTFTINEVKVHGHKVDGMRIDDCISKNVGHYDKGTGFYQLTKTEKIQDNKGVIIRNRNSKECYTGVEARGLLNLPHFGEVRVRPGMNGQWDIFVQSRSDNRILPIHTEVIYWANAPR